MDMLTVSNREPGQRRADSQAAGTDFGFQIVEW